MNSRTDDYFGDLLQSLTKPEPVHYMANLNRQLREMLLVIERNTTRAIWRQLEKDWQYHRKHPKGEVPPLYTYVTDIISHAMHGIWESLGTC